MPEAGHSRNGIAGDRNKAREADGATAPPDPPTTRKLATLTKRQEFLRVAKGRRQHTTAFLLQGRPRDHAGYDGVARVGFTCSRKVGNAVARNRARRRLREAARRVMPHSGAAGWDYVLVGRREATAQIEFTTLVSDLESALQRMHASRERTGRKSQQRRDKEPTV